MDDEDDDQGAGLGLDDLQHGGVQRMCQQCGGTSFYDNGLGEAICSDCGTTDHTTRQLVQEDGTGRDTTGRGGARRRRLRVLKKAQLPAHHLFNTLDFLTALQQVLADHCKQVASLCSVPVDLFSNAVHGVWQRYVGKHAGGEEVAPMVQLIEGKLHANGDILYYAYLSTIGREPPQIPPISLLLVTAMTYAACRLLNMPVHAGTVAQWCAEGKLTWLNAFRRLPQELQVTLKAAGPFFMPASSPSAGHLDRALHVLSTSIGLGPLPPLNAPLCAASLIKRALLPDSVLPTLLDLYTLDQYDRQYSIAYATIRQERSRDGRAAKISVVPDELEKLRRLHSQDSGAYFAALVLAAMTITPEWERWTDDHLSQSASITEGIDVAHVAAAVLQGGDAFAGRGSDGYKGIVYRGRATVTVQDPVLVQQLERRGEGASTQASGAAALDADSRAALASAAKLASSQGRATTSTDLYALLLGSQASAGAGAGGAGNTSMLGSSQMTGVYGLSQSGAGAGAGRSTVLAGSSSFTPAAAAVGGVGFSQYSQFSAGAGSGMGAGMLSSQGHAVDLIDEEEFEQGRVVTASLGPRAAQPGFDTVQRGHAWPIKSLPEVGQHAVDLAALQKHPALQETTAAVNNNKAAVRTSTHVESPSAAQASNDSGSEAGGIRLMPVLPRAWVPPKEAGRRQGRLPTHVARPSAASVRWQSLLLYLASLEGCNASEVASHYDALTLLIQLYTPIPPKGANAVVPISGQGALG